MQTAARYLGDGIRRSWLIPFPYGSPEDFTVSLDENGEPERTLVHGEDFTVLEHAVIYPLARDAQLVISLVSPLARVHALQEERVEACKSALASEARAAWHAEAAAKIAEDASKKAHAAVESLDASLTSRYENMSSDFEARARELESDLAALREDAQNVTLKTVADAMERMKIEAKAQLERGANAGISAVRTMEELASYRQGFFVLNPWLSLSQAFMGIWAKPDLAGIRHDGFFVLIPGCPGHEATGNGGSAYPGNSGNQGGTPDDPPAPGDFSSPLDYLRHYLWWLSCQHHH